MSLPGSLPYVGEDDQGNTYQMNCIEDGWTFNEDPFSGLCNVRDADGNILQLTFVAVISTSPLHIRWVGQYGSDFNGRADVQVDVTE
jgi:hypothetical protein